MKNWFWFVASILIIVLDQISKNWALGNLIPYQAHAIMPMLNFTLAFNSGAAFSFLNNTGAWHQWFFPLFSSVMSFLIIIWMWSSPHSQKSKLAGLSLILGGALGNLIDRFRLSYVIDFIDIYYRHYHWPIFNLADAAICIGAVLLFLGLSRNKP